MLVDRFYRRVREGALAIFGLVVVASSVAGCAVRERPISYVAQENVRPIKDADAVPVEVKVEDLQPDETINPFPNPLRDERRFRVKDAAGTIRGAAETELSARGFKIGTGGALVAIQLIHFEANYENEGELKTTVRANLSMRIQVHPQAGKVLYSKEVAGEGAPIRGMFMLHPATEELQKSLADAFKRLFADPAFTTAILATRQTPPPKPSVNPGRIAGAFATMSRR